MILEKYIQKPYLLRYLIVMISMALNGLGVIAVSCILLILSFFTMKSSLGFGTVANMLLLGTSADLWTRLITAAAGHEFSYTGMEQLPFRLLLVCMGILCMIFFNSFYISADLGMSPYDALGFIVEKLSGKLPFQWARILIDSICVITAFLVAGKNGNPWELIGIGTIIMAFGTGPLLAWFKRHAAEPFVQGLCGEKEMGKTMEL